MQGGWSASFASASPDTPLLSVLAGPVLVVDITAARSNITAQLLDSLHLPQGLERVIFKTDSTTKCGRGRGLVVDNRGRLRLQRTLAAVRGMAGVGTAGLQSAIRGWHHCHMSVSSADVQSSVPHSLCAVLLPSPSLLGRDLMHQTAFDPSYTAFTADGARWLVNNVPSVRAREATAGS